MTPEDYIKIISVSVVPVVIISACGLLCLAFYNRLASIVSRLRNFQRERLHEQESYLSKIRQAPVDPGEADRHQRFLDVLATQTNKVGRRARLIRLALLCLLATIASLVLCSLLAGLGVVLPEFDIVAAVLFFMGMLLLFIGVILAMTEMLSSLEMIELESRFVKGMEEQLESEIEARSDRGMSGELRMEDGD
jgi:Flp pilus assembly protein TadB